MNIYVVLLRRMDGSPDHSYRTPLDPGNIGRVAGDAEVQLLSVSATEGIFDAVVICRAPNNQAVARLLNALDGWRTDALIAKSHIHFETTHPLH